MMQVGPGKISGTRRYALVIFDMDGTLTGGAIGFAAIRAGDMSAGEGGDSGADREVACGREGQRAEGDFAPPRDGGGGGVRVARGGGGGAGGALKERGVKTALLTRNRAACAAHGWGRHGLALDYVATREHVASQAARGLDFEHYVGGWGFWLNKR